MQNFFVDAFSIFFRTGIRTLGGGYAMLPALESAIVDRRKWMERDEFADIIDIAQTCPGALAVNVSVFIGYKLKKLPGAVCTTLGVVLPSIVIMLLVAMLYNMFKANAVVASIFNGIRPAIVAIIAAPVFSMARTARIGLTNCWIPLMCMLLIYLLGVNPIYVLVAAGMCGYLYGVLNGEC